MTRFRQKLFVEDGSRETLDDEVFASAPVRVQLVRSEFWPADAQEVKKVISAGTMIQLHLNSCWNAHGIVMRQMN